MTYEELIENHAGKLVEQLVTDVITREPVTVGYETAGNEQWSIITMTIYEEDKVIAVRLFADEIYQLYFSYYDDDDEMFTITKTLSPEEITLIPKRLRAVMSKALATKEGMLMPGNFLSR